MPLIGCKYVSICLMPLHSYNHCFQFPKCAHFTRNAKCKVVFIEAIPSCWITVAMEKPGNSIKIDLPSFFSVFEIRPSHNAKANDTNRKPDCPQKDEISTVQYIAVVGRASKLDRHQITKLIILINAPDAHKVCRYRIDRIKILV